MEDKEFSNIIKRQRYLGALFTYGFITLCYLIDKYEKEGNYEECQIIVNSIKEVNAIRELDLPTKYDEHSWQYFLKAMNGMGFKGFITAHNIPYYAEEIEQEIHKALNSKIGTP